MTIVKEFDLENHEEPLGAQVLREAAERTGEVVGDGTTTATLLAYAIYADGARNVTAGASAIDLKRGLDRGLRLAVNALRGVSRPVTTLRGREQAAGDERTGLLMLRRALEVPARQIAEHSGCDGGVVVDRMRADSGSFGFDAARAASTSTFSRPASSTRPRSCAPRSRTRSPSPVCCW